MEHAKVLLALAFVPAFALGQADPALIRSAASKIDALMADHWKAAGVAPGAAVRDEVFLRRVHLDLAGRIPTPLEARAFLASGNPSKREELVRRLLEGEGHASHFQNFWADILRLKSYFVNTANVVPSAYRRFIRESLRSNKPYDRFVRELLSAKGYAWDDGAVGYYLRDPEMPLENMALTTRVFLGTRIECAQCHDHPFDKWKQTEFYRLAAFTYGNRTVNEAFGHARDAIRAREQSILDDFKREKAASSDGGKAAEARRKERLEAMEYRKVVGIIKSCVGQLLSPVGLERREAVLKLPSDFRHGDGKPGDVMRPATLFGSAVELKPGEDPAESFARWVASPDNPVFTKVIVNRLWRKMFGAALTEPLDDLRPGSKSAIPALEDHLVGLMVALRYDTRAFLAVIAGTRAYQAETFAAEFGPDQPRHFQGPFLRRMTAEQAWDSLVALANHEPDEPDRERERADDRRVAVSRMVSDAYLAFDGTRLLEMAYARLAAEKDWERRDGEVKRQLITARREGDKQAELVLRRKENELRREKGEAMVRDFLMPVLANLAKAKGGPDARPVVDELYRMNPNPAVLAVETWRRMYLPGYGPAPKSARGIVEDAKALEARHRALAATLGTAPAQAEAFVEYGVKASAMWKRASELESPAPRGHFLRTMGQSDRDFVENANQAPSIPQALAFMNGELVSKAGLLSPHSPLMRSITPDADPAEAVYLSVMSRRPTPLEREAWKAASAAGADIGDLVHALLNTRQFLFIR